MLILRQLAVPGLQVAHREVVVAVKTLQGTSAGYFNRHFQGSALTRVVLMYGPAKVGVCGYIHIELAIDPLRFGFSN